MNSGRDPSADNVGGEPIYSIGQLTLEMRGVLGATFSEIWVRGEISQCRPASSGHIYFTLKDEVAVLPAVLWRTAAQRAAFAPAEGVEVLARGSIDVYPPHGKYQFIVRQLEPVGAGALQRAFERMRERLAAEGLFDMARKKPLPLLPRRVVLITSPTGAALRDLVRVLHDRLPGLVVLLKPVPVQGAGAAAEIARAIAWADREARADVLVVGRGGGSLEDLWAFNEEVVARAIAAAATPVVSAVGHETDVTIADLVADVRAATPSQAGELVAPARQDLLRRLDGEGRALFRSCRRTLDAAWLRIEGLGERPVLRPPKAILARFAARWEAAASRLAGHRPRVRLSRMREQVDRCARALRASAPRALAWRIQRVDALAAGLRALSPLAVLERGYALIERLPDDVVATTTPVVVRSVGDVRVGARVRARLGDGGSFDARVESTEPPRAAN